jgi:glycine cleavage system H protein
MQVPEQLLYSTDHEWADVVDGGARVGITDYAQDALGDVVFVSLPSAGKHVVAGDAIGEVESTKSVSEIYAPVSGTIREVNTKLEQAPELVNSDPYGDGWLVVIELDGDTPGTLLDAAAYRDLTSH